MIFYHRNRKAMNTSGSSRLDSMLALLIIRKTVCCPNFGMAVYFSKETNLLAVCAWTYPLSKLKQYPIKK